MFVLCRGIGKHRDSVPGLKKLLQKTGLSVQAQEMYPSRVAIDQRGEQAINRDAKTTAKVSWNLIMFCDTIYIPSTTLHLLGISNGTRCVTSKSKLLQWIKPLRHETVLPPENTITEYIINLMAFIRTLKDIPTTFEELMWKIVKTLPSRYRSMHIIAETYW